MRSMITAFGFSMLLGACAADDGRDATEGSSAEAAGSFTIDSSAIATAPTAALPARLLTSEAFAESAVTSRLMKTGEAFQTLATLRTLETRESTTWHLERDAQAGQLLFLRRGAPGAATTVDESVLQQTSLRRLADWGVPSGEILRTLQRQTFAQDEDAPSSRLHRYKTFVLRGFNGVSVEGHRAVLTYSPDGVLHRALVRWPALASSGHLLRTPLTRAQIVARAITALQAAGVSGGAAALRWKYVPAMNDRGEAVLTLRVGARTPGATAGGIAQEAREIDVDVSATR